jgi:hypothetical protein
LHDFHGWTAGALWQDLRFGIKHFASIDRLAIVGERPWQRGLAMFCRPFTMARIRYFSGDQMAAARDWLEEEAGSSKRREAFDFASAPDNVAVLLKRMAGADGVQREKARDEIVAMGPEVIEHLVRAARGGRWHLRLEATRALAALRDPATAEVLAGQFEDTAEIGWAAAEGLKDMSVAGAKAVLNQLVQHASSHGVRISAHHALRAMQDTKVRPLVAPVVAALVDTAPGNEAPVAAHAALKQLA